MIFQLEFSSAPMLESWTTCSSSDCYSYTLYVFRITHYLQCSTLFHRRWRTLSPFFISTDRRHWSISTNLEMGAKSSANLKKKLLFWLNPFDSVLALMRCPALDCYWMVTYQDHGRLYPHQLAIAEHDFWTFQNCFLLYPTHLFGIS